MGSINQSFKVFDARGIVCSAYYWGTPSDLAGALQQAADEDGVWQGLGVAVDDIVQSWTTKPGYPVVTVIRDYSAQTAELTQVECTGRHWRYSVSYRNLN